VCALARRRQRGRDPLTSHRGKVHEHFDDRRTAMESLSGYKRGSGGGQLYGLRDSSEGGHDRARFGGRATEMGAVDWTTEREEGGEKAGREAGRPS